MFLWNHAAPLQYPPPCPMGAFNMLYRQGGSGPAEASTCRCVGRVPLHLLTLPLQECTFSPLPGLTACFVASVSLRPGPWSPCQHAAGELCGAWGSRQPCSCPCPHTRVLGTAWDGWREQGHSRAVGSQSGWPAPSYLPSGPLLLCPSCSGLCTAQHWGGGLGHFCFLCNSLSGKL